ncbi:UNVERIFIED_CONTAM: hypothetical protein FKN15_000742 [Acipenser sinensis]
MVAKVKTLGIVFDDEQRSGYCSGELVSGQVLVELSEDMCVTALRLVARGCARVNWSEGPGTATTPSSAAMATSSPSSSSSSSRSFREEVEYVHSAQTLIEAPGENSEESFITLHAGKHEFPFSFQLPQGPLVTSFSGKYGCIQYWVNATLERPSAPDQSVRREFPVISHMDVNTPTLLSPVSTNKEKMVGCWFFTSGPIALSARIERRGYCNAPPNYADVVSEEEFERHTPSYSQPDDLERELGRPVFAYIQEFRFQPPPLYSEIDPHPTLTEEEQSRVAFVI